MAPRSGHGRGKNRGGNPIAPKKQVSVADRDEKAGPPPSNAKLKILVSSVVYGHEDLLDSIYALLEGYGYEVFMSHKGTIPVDPAETAMKSCLKAVDECDLFLGLIFPQYGTGRENKEALSITHREVLRAIERNKPRWFLVHEHVAIARRLLDSMRDQTKSGFQLLRGVPFKSTAYLQDLRVLEMFEAAMRNEIDDIADRKGNWVQHYSSDDDARLFITAQFRRHRELLEKHLPKLADTKAIGDRTGRGAK